jgi:hypothetical protein
MPVTLPQWQEFLRGYSHDYLRVATDEELAYLSEAQRENKWLGYAPASEDAVGAAEQALPLWEANTPYWIAPVILRVDPIFRPIITPDRYRTIVTTQRHRVIR